MGQGNIFTPVCHSVHGGVSHQGDPPGKEASSPEGGTPPGRRHPPGRETPTPLAGRPPWEGGLPLQGDPPGRRHPPAGRPPIGREMPPPPTDGYCFGRYASYWNAFLFGHVDKISTIMDIIGSGNTKVALLTSNLN